MAKSVRPFSAFEWMVAMRYLRPRRKEAFISIISILSLVGIALGVATLIIVMSVMNGFRTQLLDRILGLQGHILVQSYGEVLSDFDAVVAQIRSVPGVISAYPIVEGQVLVSSQNTTQGGLVRGMRRDDLLGLTTVSETLSANAIEGFDEHQSVILGARLAAQLGTRVGDPITLIAPRGAVTPFGTMPRVKTYRRKVVAAIEGGDAKIAKAAFSEFASAADKAGRANVISPNAASRQKSSLTRQIQSMG